MGGGFGQGMYMAGGAPQGAGPGLAAFPGPPPQGGPPSSPGQSAELAAMMMTVQDRLSSYIDQCFEAARRWRDAEITPRLMECHRRRKGEYHPAQAAAIAAMGGTQSYFNITETKCSALEAWFLDVLVPQGDRPWDLEPSPIADLPPQLMNEILDAVMLRFAPDYQDAQAVAQENPEEGARLLEQIQGQVQASAVEMRDAYRAAMNDEAKKRAARMAEKVNDQLVEGGWFLALMQHIQYMATYPYAVLRGPVLEGVRRTKWDENGMAYVVEEPVLTFRAVNNFDFYWAPNSTRIGDDWVLEVIRWPLAELQVVAQSPGWIGPRVEDALREFLYPQATLPRVEHSPERNFLEGRPQMQEGPSSLVEGKHWWGTVPGQLLLDWAHYNEAALSAFGFGNVRPDRFYPINAVMVGRWCVKAGPNLDPLGRIPYHVTAFERLPGTPVGRSISEKMTDCQDGYNGSMRAAMNNMAMASGPIVGYDSYAATAPIEQIAPWMVIPFDGSMSQGRTPLHFHNVEIIAHHCIEIAKYFAEEADNRTAIPKYTYGDADVGGAGQTASGLQMLRTDAAKGIKRLLSFYDLDVLRPVLTMLVDWNNRYARDPELRGDIRVIPRGALGAITRDTREMRQQAFLELALGSPRLDTYLSDEGLAEVLRGMAQNTDMPERLVLSDEQIRMRLEQMAAQAQAEAMAGAQAKAPAKAAA